MTKPAATVRQRIALSAAAAALVLCCYWSVRFAYADILASTRSTEGLRKAIGIVPWNADYHYLLGAALEWEGETADDAFVKAVQLNPRASQVLIHLAQSAERHGNSGQAELYLLQAASFDRTFDPRWALANFYFRHGNFDAFWKWVALALDRAYGDSRAVFELCWHAPDGARRLRSLIPRDPEAMARYLRYLEAAGYTEPLAETAGQLAMFRRPGDRTLLLAACDRLISADRGQDAQQLWATLIQTGLIDAPSTPGNLLVNGDLSRQPLESGFDWRQGDCADVSLELMPRQPGLKLQFAGSQAEHCDVISQYLLLAGTAMGSFQFEYLAEPEEAGAFRWSACAGAHCSPLEAASAKKLPGGWTRIEGRFAPPGPGLVRLVLGYQRPVGRTRYEGEIRLRKIGLAR